MLKCTIAFISHPSKVMLKILQARLQQYVNHEFQMFKLDLEKAEEPEIKLPTSVGTLKKQESSRKTSTYGVNDNKLENFSRDGNTKPPYLSPEKTCMQVKKQQLELEVEQQTGSKSGKEYVKAVYCHPAYLIYMQSTS